MTEQRLSNATTRLQGLDDFVHTVMQNWKVPGLAIAVVKESDIIYAQGFGQRDAAQHLPVTPQTLFPIASCTKAFTTAAMSILVDQGKLDWDMPVRTYIPSFKLYDPAATERVTPRDLVTHRTGLPRHDLVWYNNTTATRWELFERLQYLKPTKDLRSFWQYQNLMYMAAGFLVETLSGQSWEAFVQQHIFQPLEMERSNFDIVQTAREASEYSHPYNESGDEVKEVPLYPALRGAIAPAGAIVSTVVEMSHWVSMHLRQGKYKETRIISEQQMQQMHTPQMVIPPMSEYLEMPHASYAMGWIVEPYRGFPMIDHGGGIGGYCSLTTLFPREQIGVIVLSNLGQPNIPKIVTYHIFERLTGLTETSWSERFMKEDLAYKEAEQKGKQQSEANRITGTTLSHSLEAYTGDFEHPGYGIFSVTIHEGKLQGMFNGMTFSLWQYHYDLFELVSDVQKAMKVSFLSNVKGDIDTMITSFEPTGNDIIFKRVPNRQMQDRTFLEQFVGVYEFVDMQIVIVLKGEYALSASFFGQPDYELEPYQGSEFLAKGSSAVSMKFQHDASGVVMGVAATLPSGMFYASKKGSSHLREVS